MAAKLSQKQQQTLVLGIIITVVVFWGYWKYMYQPVKQDIEAKQAKLKSLKDEIAQAERQARRLPALKAEKEKLTQNLDQLESQLPRDTDLPNIIRTLTREALQENLVFNSLAPQAKIRRDFFEVIPFTVSMKGPLNAVARFLASLGQNDRIFKASNLKMSPQGSGEELGFVPLSINYSIETYSYKGG